MSTAWEDCVLGDLITLKRGYDLPQRDRRSGTVPIVSSSGVTGHHDVAKVAAPGVVTGRYGTLGEVFYIETAFWPLNTALYVQDFKGNHPRFISYFLRMMNLSHQNAAGAVPGVNRNALHLLPAHRPPRHIQERIADVLSAFDDLIENNTRRIAILEEMAQAIYREWFVNFRFPAQEPVEMVDSELGPIPEGWTVRPLAAIAEVNTRTIRPAAAPDEIHYVEISSVSTGSIDAVRTIGYAEAPSRARRIVRHGDVIWSTVRPNRKSFSLILHPADNTIASTGFAVLTSSRVPYSYLYCAVTTEPFVEYLTNRARGSAYPAVNSGDFEEALLLIPTADLLERFHAVASDLFDLADCSRRSNSALRDTRDLLLPRLISGEVDVSELETALQAAVT